MAMKGIEKLLPVVISELLQCFQCIPDHNAPGIRCKSRIVDHGIGSPFSRAWAANVLPSKFCAAQSEVNAAWLQRSAYLLLYSDGQ